MNPQQDQDFQMAVRDQVAVYQADYMRGLYERVEKNDMGLPTGIWLPDIVLKACPEVGDDPPPEAWRPLSYAEGFPTLGVVPFWERIPEEPIPYYNVFRAYLKLLKQQGVRSLHLLMDTPEAQEAHIRVETLKAIFHLYYWEARTLAYDLFEEAVRRNMRMQLQQDVESEHFETAKGLFAKVRTYFEDPDKFNSMSPSEAISLFKAVVGLERISIGLPMNGVTKSESNITQTHRGGLSGLMLQLVQERGGVEAVSGQNALQQLMDEVMDDPEGVALVQKLVLRMQDREHRHKGALQDHAFETRGNVVEAEFRDATDTDVDDGQDAEGVAGSIAEELFTTGRMK